MIHSRRPRVCARGAIFLALAVSAVAQRSADDWPQWRGPARNGVSTEVGWTDRGVELWRAEVGLGYSTVSIRAGRVYTMGHDEAAAMDQIVCLDGETGKRIWRHRFAAERWAFMHRGGTLSTPAVAGPRVFASNRWGRLLCLNAADGEVQWTADLTATHGVELPTWGLAASPVLIDDLVVVHAGIVLAFQPDGKLTWRSARDHGASYATPVDMIVNGRRRLAVFAAKGLVILDAATGRELDTYEWRTRADVNAATPVIVGDRVFISSGYNRGCAMLRLVDDRLERLWSSKVMRAHMSSCVLYRDHLYGFDESTFKCLDLDGRELWRKRGLAKGAFVVAADRLVIISGRGDLVIADATPTGYVERSRAKGMFDEGLLWTSPVACGGRIYCRSSLGTLVCRDHRD